MGGAVVSETTTDPAMLRDIRSQGEALTEGLVLSRTHAASLDLRPTHRVMLTGSGDSFIASLAIQALYQDHLAVPVEAIPSLDASRYRPPGVGDIAVVLSVSGEVARTIEVATRARAAGATTVAVTAAIGSTLAAGCDAVIPIPEPIDRTIPHSRDYSVTLLALACLLEVLASTSFPELDAMPELIDDTVERSLGAVPDLVTSGVARTWFLGAGPDRATAMFGALKYWEAAGMPAWWDDLEEFGHGSQLMARPGDRAVVIARGPGSQRALEMVPGLRQMGLDVVLVGGSEMRAVPAPHLFTSEALDARWHPFVSCVPIQALTYVEARARGLDVAVPLFGQAHGPSYEQVHTAWTKESRIVLGEEDPS
jgi:glucosamine--fructose-6-phosphate aminotransferase (isomerizing)